MLSHVEAIGICNLVLSSDFVLNLEKTFYVPSFSKNLISISRRVPLWYSFDFNEASFSLFYKSKFVGNGVLSDDIFSINLQNDATNNVMHVNAETKHYVINDRYSNLWHQILWHIFIQRIKKLVNDVVLGTLDFIDFETCVSFIRENKLTNLERCIEDWRKYLKSYIQIYVV